MVQENPRNCHLLPPSVPILPIPYSTPQSHDREEKARFPRESRSALLEKIAVLLDLSHHGKTCRKK